MTSFPARRQPPKQTLTGSAHDARSEVDSVIARGQGAMGAREGGGARKERRSRRDEAIKTTSVAVSGKIFQGQAGAPGQGKGGDMKRADAPLFEHCPRDFYHPTKKGLKRARGNEKGRRKQVAKTTKYMVKRERTPLLLNRFDVTLVPEGGEKEKEPPPHTHAEKRKTPKRREATG